MADIGKNIDKEFPKITVEKPEYSNSKADKPVGRQTEKCEIVIRPLSSGED